MSMTLKWRKDNGKAVEWYTKAAEQDDTDAQARLKTIRDQLGLK